MPRTSITMGELWEYFRASENAYRYYSDVVAAIIARMEGGAGRRIDDLDGAKLDVLDGPWPTPSNGTNPCIPPFCDVTPARVADGVQDLANRASALNAITRQVVERLPSGLGVVRHYLSQLPGIHWRRQR